MQCSVKEDDNKICPGIALTQVGNKGFCKKHKEEGIKAAKKTTNFAMSGDGPNQVRPRRGLKWDNYTSTRIN